MTMNLTKDAINLRDELDKNRPIPAGPPYQQHNLGTGDGTLTTFAMPKGWQPLGVYKAGSRQTEGSGNDYTTSFDGFVYSVVFSVAPASGNVIIADAWRKA
jgi:hypothetical protein